MDFIVGGKAQGKLAYVMQHYRISREDVCDGAVCTPEEAEHAAVLWRYHEFIRRFPECRPVFRGDAVVLCDEVGCGIVPVDREERQWRENVGRAGCVLAAEAERVTRIVCGIPIRLK